MRTKVSTTFQSSADAGPLSLLQKAVQGLLKKQEPNLPEMIPSKLLPCPPTSHSSI